MLELELKPHFEYLADPMAADYDRLVAALASPPLYHQWKTYQAKTTSIVVNTYNTGTGKTKAALMRLLDLNREFNPRQPKSSNVLFIAPTNELLRQHEGDVTEIVKRIAEQKLGGPKPHLVLRLDATRIRELGGQLGEKFSRPSDQLQAMLSDPGKVLTDEEGYRPEGKHPYIVITNPDIFYYALYGLGNPHEKKLLFRNFIENFKYIIVDEFHYYNAKQLANFLFFLTLSREWGYFKEGRQVCLLTATPVKTVRNFLENLTKVDPNTAQVELAPTIEYIEPGDEPAGLPLTPALAPIRLKLYSAEGLGAEDGLVEIARRERATVDSWLSSERHGAFISSALWRVNRLYEAYGGEKNGWLGRLTGAEKSEARKQAGNQALIMATPTVDIGYNFGRKGKDRQSIDFLLFDARTSDEFIQRLGRAGRVLGRTVTNIPSEVWAVVPDELLSELKELPGPLNRAELNRVVTAKLPPRNGLYSYVQSGALVEAFLPLYSYRSSLPKEDRELAERLYEAVVQVYGANLKRFSYKRLENNTRRYLGLQSKINQLLKEAEAESFEFGPASLYARILYRQPEQDAQQVEDLITEANVIAVNQEITAKPFRRKEEIRQQRREAIEEYYKAAARFNFRDSYQPPQVLAHDLRHLLAGADFTTYSALHILQNYQADWWDVKTNPQQYQTWLERADLREDTTDLPLACEIRGLRTQRWFVHFQLNRTDLTKKEWEEKYCSTLAVEHEIRLSSDDGPLPQEVNQVFEKLYLPFYAVPAIGAEARTLVGMNRLTMLYTNRLQVDFSDCEGQSYLMVLGSSALQISCEPALQAAHHISLREVNKQGHIFDWEC